MIRLAYSFSGRPLGLSIFALLALLVFSIAHVSADVDDPVPRVQCPVSQPVRIVAEGLSSPDGLAFSPAGALFVAEESAGRVSRVEPYGAVRPVLSGLMNPEGIAFDDLGNLYVVEDVAQGRLIKMNSDGVATTLAADRDAPEGVVWSADGNAYITESNVQFATPLNYRTHVTAISPAGAVTRILTNTLLWSYAGVTMGPDGYLYVTNEASGTGTSHSVFRVNRATGSRTLFTSGLVSPEGLRFSPDGDFPLYVAEEDTGAGFGRLSRISADGSHIPFCTGFYQIEDVVLDDAGRWYVSEDSSGTILRIEPGPPDRAPPRAIILFIGDGMGEGQRIAGRWSAAGQSGALALDAMPYGGWTGTSAANNPVTDSAAAATAIATGVKTNNGVIGQDPAGKRLTTILERAKAQGWAVGLVSNVQMAHATPAAFAAHVPDRSMMTQIAAQMLAAEVDVLLGGGEDEFLPTTATGHYPEPGERTDGRNLIDEAISDGYTYVYDAAGLGAVVPTATTRLLGLFADEGMVRPYAPSLVEMTQRAIDILSQDPDGFFLMVEGGQIDWAAFANEAADVISDISGFDEAIDVALKYAATAGDTLVIVTADHETGGMSVDLSSSGAPDEDGPFLMPGGRPFFVNWSTTSHTAVDIPTTAQGPWSDLLSGRFENTHLHDVMRLALDSLPAVTLSQVAEPQAGAAVRPGAQITYTLLLANRGATNATGLLLTDTLPSGTRYVPGSVSTTPGLEIAATPPPHLLFTGTLPSSSTLSATFRVKVRDVPSGTLLVNTADLFTEQFDPATSTVTHPVVVIPNLSIAKTATPASGSFVGAGERITYTVVVHNNGDLAWDAVISDKLDLTNVTLVMSDTTRGVLSGPNPVRVAGFDLGPSESVTLTLGVIVAGEANLTIINNRSSISSVAVPTPQFSNWVLHIIGGADLSRFYLPIIVRDFSEPAPAPGRQ